MSKINVLDKHTAELIAAGEVVERPSSVVKELAENSIDAGSSAITVEIAGGGVDYIRITDNGCGIGRNDVPTAFLRHATSKVKTESDLDSILTLGFRGEALASICAVAKVDLITREENEDVGTHYIIEGGEEVSVDDAGCPVGTTIVIKNLFYNTPARMKFLKKNVSEGNAVAAVIDRLALSHPEISFRFIRDSKQVLMTPGDGKLISAVYAVYKREFASSLIPVSYENSGITVSGYISKPSASRSTRAMQHFFINGRFVKTVTASEALITAYKNSVMTGKFPACVLQLQMPCDMVDANVHPAKIEVRFTNERQIFNAVYFAAKTALLSGDSRPVAELAQRENKAPAPFTVSGEQRWKPREQSVQTKLVESEMSDDKTYTKNTSFTTSEIPFKVDTFSEATGELRSFDPATGRIPASPFSGDSGKSYRIIAPDIEVSDDFEEKIHNATDTSYNNTDSGIKDNSISDATINNSGDSSFFSSKTDVSDSSVVPDNSDDLKINVVGEVFATYIIVQIENKLLLIDKHAAHERIIFNRLKEGNTGESAQLLLSPVMVTLPKQQYDAVVISLETLEKAGVIIDDFADGTLAVRGIPMLSDNEDISGLIEEIAQKLADNKTDLTSDYADWIYHSVACRAAVKAGDRSDYSEIESLALKIARDESILYCPHGRPVAVWLTRRELEKMFRRIV